MPSLSEKELMESVRTSRRNTENVQTLNVEWEKVQEPEHVLEKMELIREKEAKYEHHTEIQQDVELGSEISKSVEETEAELSSLNAIGRQAPVALHTISSQLASVISTLTFYPLDVLRTRYMSQDGSEFRRHNGRIYSSIARSMYVIYSEEGIKTLFRGSLVAVCGSATAWGLYMFIYRTLCNATELTSYATRSGVSFIASCIATCMTCPIFLIKSRMQLEETALSSHYRSFSKGILHVVQTSGVASLWRGVSAQILLVFPNALALPTYDLCKGQLLKWRYGVQTKHDLNLYEVCVCSSIAKLLVLTLSHPLMLVKIRIQDQRALLGKVPYRDVVQSMIHIVKFQGVRGLYRGFTTSLLHSFPRSLLQYAAYEKTLTYLCHRQSQYSLLKKQTLSHK